MGRVTHGRQLRRVCHTLCWDHKVRGMHSQALHFTWALRPSILPIALSVLPLHLLKQGLLQDLWLHQLAKLTGQGTLWSYTHSYQPCHPWDYWYTPPCPTFTWVRGIQIQGLMLVWQIAQLLNCIILYGHASTFLPVRELLKAPQFKSRPKATLQLLPFSQLFGHGDTKAIDVTRLCSKASVSWIHTLSFSNSVALDDLLNSLDINYHIHKVEKCLSPSYKMTCVKYLQGACGGASAHLRQVATLIPVNGLGGILSSASSYFQLQQIFWCHKKTDESWAQLMPSVFISPSDSLC